MDSECSRCGTPVRVDDFVKFCRQCGNLSPRFEATESQRRREIALQLACNSCRRAAPIGPGRLYGRDIKFRLGVLVERDTKLLPTLLLTAEDLDAKADMPALFLSGWGDLKVVAAKDCDRAAEMFADLYRRMTNRKAVIVAPAERQQR